MSKISLKPNSAGTANFEIAAPATNTDRTFDLPDEAGTVLTNASDIESQVKTASNATGSAPIYACRAWVNFNGEGTVSIRDSGNVSSISDLGTGLFVINFTTAMPDVNYTCSYISNDKIGIGGLDGTISTSGFLISVADSRDADRIDRSLNMIQVIR